MPSRTIRPTEAAAPAPFAYTIGAADGLTPEAVFAQWDGSGAGGDFLPCVSYYSAEGVLLDRAFPTTGAVTAGDTAEVSYRPFERGGGGAAPAPALVTTDGVHTVNPTTELLIDGNMVLANLGGGIARLSATGGAATPPVQWQAIRASALRTDGASFTPDWGVPDDTQQSLALVQPVYTGPGFPAGPGLCKFVVLSAGFYMFAYGLQCSTLTVEPDSQWETNFTTPPFHWFPFWLGNWQAVMNFGLRLAEWPVPGFGFGASAVTFAYFSAVPSAFQVIGPWFAPRAGEDPTGATTGIFVAVRLKP